MEGKSFFLKEQDKTETSSYLANPKDEHPYNDICFESTISDSTLSSIYEVRFSAASDSLAG